MLRRGEERRGRSHLDDLPQIHHRDAAADVLDQPQIVRDEQVGQLQLLLQIHQQVDHLRLHRDVERRDRLVEDDERRVERERARQADALPLAAAELVRVALEVRRVEADQPEQLGDARAARRPVAEPVDDERLLDDLPRAHPRVERRVRILKDDLHVAPRRRAGAPARTQHVVAAEPHVARRRLDQPQQAAAGRRLAAARLADQPERLALVDAEAHVVDRGDARARPEAAAAAGEMLDEMRDLDERHQSIADCGSRLRTAGLPLPTADRGLDRAGSTSPS